MNNTEVVLIPYWIYESLQRTEKPLSAILCYKTMKSITSTEDLSGLYQAPKVFNELINRLIATNDMDRNYPGDFPTSDLVNLHLYDSGKTLSIGESDEILTIANLARDTLVVNDIVNRLFNVEVKSDKYPTPFEVKHISPGRIALIIYPGYFTNQTTKPLMLSLVEEILKLLYVYQETHEVARLSIFKKYLELL